MISESASHDRDIVPMVALEVVSPVVSHVTPVAVTYYFCKFLPQSMPHHMSLYYVYIVIVDAFYGLHDKVL